MKLILIADSAYDQLKEDLKAFGFVIEVPFLGNLYYGVENHPDLHCHFIDDQLFLSKDLAHHMRPLLDIEHLPYHTITEDLGSKYPATAFLNAINFPNYFIHPKQMTASLLSEYVQTTSRTWVQLKQGYMRCSALPVGDNALITSDPGIISACKDTSIATLLIQPGHINLLGHSYGFIGGTGGQIGDTIFFNGDLNLHPDSQAIIEFISQQGFNFQHIPHQPLTDIGSILYYEGEPSE